LVSLVGNEGNNGLAAARRVLQILSAISEERGESNHWRAIVDHMSIRDRNHASTLYDMHAVGLINYLLASIKDNELRMDERRLLQSLRFTKVLLQIKKLVSEEQETRQQRGTVSSPSQSPSGGNTSVFVENDVLDHDREQLLQHIEVYMKMVELENSETRVNLPKDKGTPTKENDMGDVQSSMDLSNPKDVFAKLLKQVLEEGHINELTKILYNLLGLPPDAHEAWNVIARLVGEACVPIHEELWNRVPGNGKLELNVGGPQLASKALSPVPSSSTLATSSYPMEEKAVYPNYNSLKHLLQVRNTKEAQNKEMVTMKKELNNVKEKMIRMENELENAYRVIEESKKKEKEIQMEREREKALENEKERQREKERQKEREREMERTQEKQHEQQKETQRQKEREIQLQKESVREQEREKEKTNTTSQYFIIIIRSKTSSTC